MNDDPSSAPGRAARLINPAAAPARSWAWLVAASLSLALFSAGAACPPAYADVRTPLVFGKGLLWRVDDGGAPSYLFGTLHAGDERVTRLPRAVKRAFDGSAVFVMEVIPDPDLSATMRQAMALPAGRHLKDLISARLYQAAVADLAHYNLPEEVVNRLKPWAAASTLSVPETAAGTPLDKRLYQMARQQKKSIFGLESAAEQVAVLNKMALPDQVELLKGAVATFDKRFEIYEALIRDYLARDVTAIFKLNEKYTKGDQHLAKEVNERIFLDRNKRMVKRIIPRLKEGNAFIAIGAGHLPGAQGVLRLLQGRGYKVSLVY